MAAHPDQRRRRDRTRTVTDGPPRLHRSNEQRATSNEQRATSNEQRNIEQRNIERRNIEQRNIEER
jgi:hypothetical protein